MADLSGFGNRLRLLRLCAGLTQGDLAERLGVARSSVANMEAGRQNPPLARAVDAAAVLDCTVGILIGEIHDDRLTAAEATAAELAGVEEEMRKLAAEQADLRRRASALGRRVGRRRVRTDA